MERRLAAGTFFGATSARRTAPGFMFAESTFACGTEIPSHTHEHAFFYLVVEGLCVERVRGGCRESGPGTLVFHPAGEPHADHWPRAGRCFHIEVTGERLRALRQQGPVLDQPEVFAGGPAVRLAAQLRDEARNDDPFSALALEGLALEFLAASARGTLAPAREASPRWLRRALDLLHEQFREPLSLQEIADAAGVHPTHLARTFRRAHGCSPGEYLRRLRIEWARAELLRSDTPLPLLSVEAGFADQAHFTRTFRRYTGTTPAQFRRHHRPPRGPSPFDAG
jgi:AraC family transcriptional regulator